MSHCAGQVARQIELVQIFHVSETHRKVRHPVAIDVTRTNGRVDRIVNYHALLVMSCVDGTLASNMGIPTKSD